jgi:predicted aspartyl protease
MNKILYLFFALFIISCGGINKTLNSGTVNAVNYKEVLPFDYDNNFALIKVVINTKTYKFLIDTGAPTVISNAIYETLQTTKPKYVLVEDSQGQTKTQKVTSIPELKIGNLTYINTGAIVADLRNVFEFNCLEIDGIIGANQMAKSFWKFDYQNKEVFITDQLENYELTTYTDSIPFSISSQKTPYVRGYVNGTAASFIFDTGYAGYIDHHDKRGALKAAVGFTRYGSSSVGLYGALDSVTTRTIKLDSLRMGSVKLNSQIINTEQANLIGNGFMNHYDMVINWQVQKIYLKKIKEFENAPEHSFGFAFRIKENKAMVISLIEELPIDLKIGDVILSINNYDLSNLNSSNACERYQGVDLENIELVDVVYVRDGTKYKTTLTRTTLLE